MIWSSTPAAVGDGAFDRAKHHRIGFGLRAACRRASSSSRSATLVTERARPAIGSPLRTRLPFAVAVLK